MTFLRSVFWEMQQLQEQDFCFLNHCFIVKRQIKLCVVGVGLGGGGGSSVSGGGGDRCLNIGRSKCWRLHSVLMFILSPPRSKGGASPGFKAHKVATLCKANASLNDVRTAHVDSVDVVYYIALLAALQAANNHFGRGQ